MGNGCLDLIKLHATPPTAKDVQLYLSFIYLSFLSLSYLYLMLPQEMLTGKCKKRDPAEDDDLNND